MSWHDLDYLGRRFLVSEGSPLSELVKRHLRPVIDELLGDLRVVVVNGPRQSGKTTLLRELHAASGGQFYTLDQPEILQ